MACSDKLNLQNTAGENINVRFQMAIYSIRGHYIQGQRFTHEHEHPTSRQHESVQLLQGWTNMTCHILAFWVTATQRQLAQAGPSTSDDNYQAGGF